MPLFPLFSQVVSKGKKSHKGWSAQFPKKEREKDHSSLVVK